MEKQPHGDPGTHSPESHSPESHGTEPHGREPGGTDVPGARSHGAAAYRIEHGGAGSYDSALEHAGIDLLGMDLESLRTVQHPVLSALVGDLRARIEAPGGEALWGFDNDSPGDEHRA